MSPQTLLDQLTAHRTIGGIARTELEWIAAHGTLRELPAGDVLTTTTGEVAGLFIVLTGRLSIQMDRGAGTRKIMEWVGGDITGLLPYSRLKAPPAPVQAEEPTTVLVIDRGKTFEALIRECPEFTAVAVHVMLDRARVFTTSELFDEKLVSLGRLAAGLAHELNNPASAVVRDASMLGAALTRLERTTRSYCALSLSDKTCAAVQAVRDEADAAAGDASASSLEIADREDALSDWLDSHGLSGADAHGLVDAGLTVEHLERLAGAADGTHMAVLLDHLTAEHTVHRLAADVETAASRIHELVAAVKRFTYMDQAMVTAPLHLAQGLSDTLMVVGSKAKQKSIALELDVDPGLPAVDAFGGELNQVWTNLVDNALDATPPGGRVAVSARQEGDTVVVRVSDTGHGIPADVQPRIFDTFFTTKGVGKGTGLGLDIARRLIVRHRGKIDLTTGPDGTEFRVTLPVATTS